MKQKEIVELLILDKDINQIADTLNLSVKTIRNLLSAARKQLRSILTQRT
ncbi:MAG: hypothetical protein J6C95_08495 [Muribaculaceae bacterium]|nr:hypothetical protein [Muribaculaceae bacterium]